jgi:hypothetical protein
MADKDKAAEDAKFTEWLHKGGANVTTVKGDREWNDAVMRNVHNSTSNGKNK